MDAEVVVGVGREDQLGLYAALANAHAVVAGDAVALTREAMRVYGACFEPEAATAEGPAAAPAPAGTPFQRRDGPPPAPGPWRPALSAGPASGWPRPPAPDSGPGGRSSPLDLRALVERAAGMLNAAPRG